MSDIYSGRFYFMLRYWCEVRTSRKGLFLHKTDRILVSKFAMYFIAKISTKVLNNVRCLTIPIEGVFSFITIARFNFVEHIAVQQLLFK